MDVKKGKARSVFIGVCVAPAVILFIIFMLVPTFNVFKMSLYRWGGFSNNKEFVGLENFINVRYQLFAYFPEYNTSGSLCYSCNDGTFPYFCCNYFQRKNKG